MVEKLVDVIVKLRLSQCEKKDQPPNLLCNIPTSLTFQQLLEKEVPDISNVTASCQAGFKKHGEQLPTGFIDVRLNDSIGKLHITGSNFVEYCIKEQEQHEEQPPPKQSVFQVTMTAALVKELPPQVNEKNSFDALCNRLSLECFPGQRHTGIFHTELAMRMTSKVNIYIFGLTKCTIYCKKCSCFSLLLLLCSFFRLKELFRVKSGLTTLFKKKMPKLWVAQYRG